MPCLQALQKQCLPLGFVHARAKQSKALPAGAEQLFWGDVHASAERFKALFSYLADGVVFNADQHMLDDLPLSCRRLLLRVVAGFLSYYSAAAVSTCWL